MPSAMVDATVAAPPLDLNARRHLNRTAALSNAGVAAAPTKGAKTVASRYLSPFSKPPTSSISSTTASSLPHPRGRHPPPIARARRTPAPSPPRRRHGRSPSRSRARPTPWTPAAGRERAAAFHPPRTTMPSAMVDATVAAPPLDLHARRHRHRAAALSNDNSNNAAKTVASRYLSPFSKPATSSISSATASSPAPPRPPSAVATNAMASCGSATTTTTRTLAVAFQSPAYSLDTSSRARSASPVAVPPAPTPEKKKKKQSGAAGTAAGSAKVFDASQNTYRWQPSAPAAKHGPSRRASVDGGANEYLLALSSSSSDETDTSSSSGGSGEGAIAPPRRSVGSGPPRPYPIRSVVTMGSSARFTMGTRSDRFGYPATPSPSPAPMKKKSLFNGLLSSPFARSSLNKQPSPSKPVASAFRRTASSTPARGSTDGDAKLRPPAAINKAEEEHRLRILYTQHLQWRLVNAQAGAALSLQTIAAERALSGAWISILRMRKSVAIRKMQLQLLRNNCKLFAVLRGQCRDLLSILASMNVSGEV
ncbi:hypothetical protein HU200_027842 [Digitaria exilis]|uniref:Uncharacterized protein n=1 Tax=Digitaria exilis TaxID=1010633 RepID=A0A835BXA6_9POAL|nr:hypothetical protein HU200_027842 [Digitaria exilis]